MVDRRGVDDADLLALDEARHGDDQREFLRVALIVAAHRDGGLVAVAGQHDLRGGVEELRIRLRDIKAAKGVGGPDGAQVRLYILV